MDPLVHLPGSVIHLPVIAAEHSRRIVYGVFVLLAAGLAIAIITASGFPDIGFERVRMSRDDPRHHKSVGGARTEAPGGRRAIPWTFRKWSNSATAIAGAQAMWDHTERVRRSRRPIPGRVTDGHGGIDEASRFERG